MFSVLFDVKGREGEMLWEGWPWTGRWWPEKWIAIPLSIAAGAWPDQLLPPGEHEVKTWGSAAVQIQILNYGLQASQVASESSCQMPTVIAVPGLRALC